MKSLLILLTLTATLALAPGAQAQACEDFDPHGNAGIYEGKPWARYVILDCQMTPIILDFNTPNE